MGVHGLWELLAPVGRRVSVETLAGKKLAIDASIWMIQFMKAMRDDKGEMVRNAHVLGFFRRICKLLYLRTKPVFVFDGGTPALKRRTVIARRRQRENAQAKIRKNAEKLLLSHIKAMRLKELALDLQKQKQQNDIKGKKPMFEKPDDGLEIEKNNCDMHLNSNQEKIDEMLAASLAAEENEVFSVNASASRDVIANREAFVDYDDDGDDEDEEMILPEMNGKVDPAVLAALPPSMQLDLLAQMRERLMAENRQKYQKVKKAPERFSELQIQAYLKTVAFRREIDVVQKAAAGRGVGGVQTSRIASEANREFIYSSSFTGDKRSLTSGEESIMMSDQSQAPQLDNCSAIATNDVHSERGNNDAALPTVSKTGDALDGVETYLDERGRLRVSRVRALGIRMTRDLQRNLDLMKEIDEEREVNQEDNSFDSILNQDLINGDSSRTNDEVHKNDEPSVDGARIEISFDDTPGLDDGDDLFSQLVAGDPMIDFSVDQSDLVKEPFLSSSDNEWEEGSIGDKEVALQQCKGGLTDEGEVEWEEGSEHNHFTSSSLNEIQRTVTKGARQEEADLHEAIRRSLEDTSCSKSMLDINEYYVSEGGREISVEEVGEEDAQLESLTSDVSKSSSVSKSFLGISPGNSAAFMESKSKENLLNLMDIQHADGNGTLTEEKLYPAGPLPEEVLPSAEGKVQVYVCDAATNNSENKQAGTIIEAKDDTSSDSVLRFSIADSSNSRSLASHEIFCNTTEPFVGLDDAAQSTMEKLNSIASIAMEAPLSNASYANDTTEEEIINKHLEEEILLLDKERRELGNEQRKLERNAESVSGEMFAECQELLQMFGLPYIISPMEAEAQCAFMELSNLVDGVVTDDSDALLFGSRSVYKNIFDDRKYVETYFMKDIESELGLDREKLINMALLLGSDYTEGISGIGIVNAIEVVNAFPNKEGLCEFREWIESPDPSILGNVDAKGGGSSRKKGSKGVENIKKLSDEERSVNAVERKKQIFMENHRNVSKNWHIPSSFPSEAVFSAYASPQVDKSTESFSWGKPDLFALRKLCLEKFGWGNSKADELLVPVLKEYNKHETQLRLEAFYTFNERFAKIRSKRITKAVKGITGNISSDLMDPTIAQHSGKGKKRKAKVTGEDYDANAVDGTEGGARGRGRGRGRGRNRKQSSNETAFADSETSHEEEMDPKYSEETHELRRSVRPRKCVDYSVCVECDHDDGDGSPFDDDEATSTVHDGSKNEVDDDGGDREIGDGDDTTEKREGKESEEAFKPKSATSALSDDYLQFGGGFCMDEGEEATTEAVPGDPTVQEIPEIQAVDPIPIEEELTANPFRAMPNLRKKKRS